MTNSYSNKGGRLIYIFRNQETFVTNLFKSTKLKKGYDVDNLINCNTNTRHIEM